MPDVHRGALRRADLAHHRPPGADAGHLEIDGHPADGERDHALVGRPAHQRRRVGVEQRVVDQFGDFGVDVSP